MNQLSHASNSLLTADEPLYKNIINDFLETSSVKKTSQNLGVSEVRVRKVLLTEGLWSSRTSILVQHYLDENYSTVQIAEKLHTTVKAVQQYLPYSRGIYMGEHLSASAINSAEYRERIRIARERVLKRKQDVYVQEGWREEDIKMDFSKEGFTGMESERIDEINGIDELNGIDENKRGKLPEGAAGVPHFEQYPGIVCFRDLPEGMVDWDKAKCRGVDIMRLHLELMREPYNPYDDADDGHGETEEAEQKEDRRVSSDPEEREITRVLRSYGNMKYGDTISRDILIPGDMPLYALHYAIQRLFGWQNSHLHKFNLPPGRFCKITGNNAGKWSDLVGVLFRSPWMEEGDAFWADDYEYGSFKTWIRKKYTGPYLSLCHGEGIIQCKKDVKAIFKRIPQVKILYSRYEGKLEISNVEPLREKAVPGQIEVTEDDRKRAWFGTAEKAEILDLEDCPAEALFRLFIEGRPDDLLERLPVEEVLTPAGRHPGDALAFPEELLTTYEAFMDEDLVDDIKQIVKSRMDDPWLQPVIGTPTDVLYYNYDFGDDWMIRITASMDACDLVEQGRVTQQDLDEAIASIYKNYRPVCIAADGPFLVDDAGGLSGYIRFLRAINPTAEKEYWGKGNVPGNWAYEDKQFSLEWAKSLGWTERVNVKRML